MTKVCQCDKCKRIFEPRVLQNGEPYIAPTVCNDDYTIKFNKIKAIINDWAVDDDEHELLEQISDIIDEEEDSLITECRNTAIKENLPLYFVYYEETGVFEVYVTKTKELFEKRHCSKHLSDYEFNYIVRQYLDDYSEIVRRQLGGKE